MGVAVDETGRVLDQSGRPFHNVYAAGEIMSGNILTKGYLGGFGMTIGVGIRRACGKDGGHECPSLSLSSSRKPTANS